MFELALDCRCLLGESPIWSPGEGALHFIDIKGRALHRWEVGTGHHTAIALEEDPGSIALVEGGGILIALRSGLWLYKGDRPTKLADNPEDQATNRFNDGRTDPAGRFIVGTMNEPRENATASLYRFDRRGLVAIEGGLFVSNGLAFSPDGRTMFHADTKRHTIWTYSYDPETGEATGRRTFATLPEGNGRPDGAAVDAEGCYWAALYEGGRVQRYAPTGELLAEYPVPARCVTMPAFGGNDLRTLYVTTASAGRPAAELEAFPHSGGIFAMRVDVPGRREPLFDPSR
jgi:sugar lactone lactonase YvrE